MQMVEIKIPAFNFGKVDFWRSAAPHYACRHWTQAMRRFALQHGRAVAMLGNDDAVIVEKCDSNKSGISVRKLSAYQVKWIQK